jgi:hypothetical protein
MVVRFVGLDERLSRDSVTAINPSGEILQLTSLAAERSPVRIDRLKPAEHAQRSVALHLIARPISRAGQDGCRALF